jgi:hypothetical protein
VGKTLPRRLFFDEGMAPACAEAAGREDRRAGFCFPVIRYAFFPGFKIRQWWCGNQYDAWQDLMVFYQVKIRIIRLIRNDYLDYPDFLKQRSFG